MGIEPLRQEKLMPPNPEKRDRMTAEQIVKTLNECYAIDPVACWLLVCHRVSCNQGLADHPTIQVRNQERPVKAMTVSMVGLVNGFVEPLTGYRVSTKWSDDFNKDGASQFLGFEVFDPFVEVKAQPA